MNQVLRWGLEQVKSPDDLLHAELNQLLLKKQAAEPSLTPEMLLKCGEHTAGSLQLQEK